MYCLLVRARQECYDKPKAQSIGWLFPEFTVLVLYGKTIA